MTTSTGTVIAALQADRDKGLDSCRLMMSGNRAIGLSWLSRAAQAGALKRQPNDASDLKANKFTRGVACPWPAHVAPDDRLWRRRAEQYEGRRHHQLVSHWIQESAKCGCQLHLQPEQELLGDTGCSGIVLTLGHHNHSPQVRSKPVDVEMGLTFLAR